MGNKTIGFLTYDWAHGTKPLQPNGCAWYRCLLPKNELEKFGWKTGLGFPRWHDEYGYGLVISNDKAIHGWEILVFKLVMRKEITDQVREAKARGQKIVVDIDDFFEGLEPTNRAYASTDPKLHPENNRDHYFHMIDEADAVITSTPFLYDFYSKKRKNVFLVRNGIDIDRWKMRKDKAKRSPVVGWVGATPWRSSDLESLNPHVPKFLKKYNLTFHHSGHTTDAPFAYDQIGYHRQKSTIMPMAPILDYPKLFPPIDIGLVPLNNLEFNHAKSFIKGLEYAVAGVPFISSYSPEYQYLADAGVGRIAHTPEEWTYHLTELLDPQMRLDDAMVNYEIVKEKFSMEVRGAEWNEVMEKISAL
jgi:hypothetical protein